MPLLHYYDATPVAGDTTPPTVEVTSAVTLSRISRVAGADVTTFGFTPSEAIRAWQIRSVPGNTSPVTAGTLIEAGPVTNPSFETDLSGWATAKSEAAVAEPTRTRVNTWASDGSWSQRYQGSVVGGQWAYTYTNIPASPGMNLRALVDLNIASNTGIVQVALAWMGTGEWDFLGHGVIQNRTTGETGIVTSDMTTTFTAPAGTTRALLTVGQGGGASGSVDMRFDNVRVEYPAGQQIMASITDDELVAAEGGVVEGAKILKVFVQDAAGNWSI